MAITSRFLVVAAVLLFSLSVSAGDTEEPTLEECQQYQQQIDHYTTLRKQGGTSREMEWWKQQRERWEDKFRDGDCRKRFGKQVR